MRFTLSLSWRDLRSGSRSLWIFCACLALGVALIAATGGLHQQVRDSLVADTRSLFGGDLEVQAREPLTAPALAWMRSRGAVSLQIELRTMLRTADGRSQLVELLSVDERYPLYGRVDLQPATDLREALAWRDGRWGAAIDPVLATRLGLRVGDRIEVGTASLVVQALVARQPDRSLRADWRGQPVLIDAGALRASELMQAGSRAAYRYRVRTDTEVGAWRDAFIAAFPQERWEVRTFAERGNRLAEVLGQLGSGLLLIGFSALFVGGLGVFNSVHAYLGGKLATIATLRALGLRDRRLAWVYLCQVLILAGGSSLVGAVLGGLLAMAGAAAAAGHMPLTANAIGLASPLWLAWMIGVLTALAFALPAIGRALSVSPAALFRGIDGGQMRTPPRYWALSGAAAMVVFALTLVLVPEPLFALGFVAVVLALLVSLEGVVRWLRHAARRLSGHRLLAGRFALRLALANLHRPGSPLRLSLLSLGSALTLLVASTLVVGALLRILNDTVPEQAPALVFYDVPTTELQRFRGVVEQSAGFSRLEVAPLVLGRIEAINGDSLQESADPKRALEARDEHKLSYRANDFDHVAVVRGAWWPPEYRGPPRVAMEDREADQLGLSIGDRLRFDILGTPVDAELAAIYSQRRLQSRFWFEAIFSDGTLDPFISRYVGAAHFDAAGAVAAQDRIAAVLPSVVTVRTEGILTEARRLLAKAGAGLAAIAGVSLVASLLVLASVLAATRARQVYDACVLHTLGARVTVIRRALQLEYLLLAVLTTVFATLVGSALAFGLLQYRLALAGEAIWWTGALAAAAVSTLSLGIGAHHLLHRLRLTPALLLRESA